MIPNRVGCQICLFFGGDTYSCGDEGNTYKICPKQASRNPGWHECRHETTIHKMLNPKNH